MKLQNRYKSFLDEFIENDPAPVTLLAYRTPFELLVAVVLSAQCTDKRVNGITPALFARFPTAHHLAGSSVKEVFGYIRSVSYPNSKARYLVTMAQQLVKGFGGKVPSNAVDLQKLMGVGRKTAHVVVATLYGEGVIAVDTHVFRVSKRLGLVSDRASTPLAVEKELMLHVPTSYRVKVSHWFISHGRRICTAIRPRCGVCPFKGWCRFYGANNGRRL